MKSRKRDVHRNRVPRQGSVLVGVLVCLAIATALVTSSVRTALNARRVMRTQQQLRQTELLLTAGIGRATRQLQMAADYTGETWDLPSGVFPRSGAAQVLIDISSSSTQDLSRSISVTARLSTGPHTTIQRSFVFSINPE